MMGAFKRTPEGAVGVALLVWVISSLGGGDGSEGRVGVGVLGKPMACIVHDTSQSRPFFFPP